MILASLLAIVVAFVVTVVVARILYKFSFKKELLQSRKDYVINAVIVAFVFFCVSSIVYVTLINI